MTARHSILGPIHRSSRRPMTTSRGAAARCGGSCGFILRSPCPTTCQTPLFFMLEIFENRVDPQMLLTGYSQISCHHHPMKNYSISIGVSNRKTTLFPECFMQNQCLFLPDDDSSIGFESSVSGSPRSKRPWAR